jgi:hypothetical protein
MSSVASPPGAARVSRRPTLGGVAFGLVLGVLVAGIVALALDEEAVQGDPFSTSRWPVHPLWIVVPMGMALSVALVLAGRAIALKRGKALALAAVAVGLVPELLIVFALVVVVINAAT